MLEGGITLESLFEPTPRIQTPSVEDVGIDDFDTRYPGFRSDLKCGECGSPMQLVETGKYTNKREAVSAFYGCSRYPECKGCHGAHPDGSPKGTPANRETRLARIRAHAAFDQIWKQHLVKHRGAAYNWMRSAMGLARGDAHIGMFTKDQCDELIKLVYRDYPTLMGAFDRLLYDDSLEDL